MRNNKIVGVVCAGGAGERLLPLTLVTNKHLLPVYDRPMILYPIKTLVDSGITDVVIVTGGHYAGEYLKLLGDGKEYGLTNLQYVYQKKPRGGIADALSYAENIVNGRKCVVILGDNIFEEDIRKHVEEFKNQKCGAKVFLKPVSDTHKYGVAKVENNKIVEMEEKPVNFNSNLAVVGLYMYDKTVFDIIRSIVPSPRGELEITDVNKKYLEMDRLTYGNMLGYWCDCGSIQNLTECSFYMSKKEKKNA